MRISDWSSDVCSSDLENAALDDRYTRTTELIRMLALTGCRRSEVIEIRWSEIDSAGSAFRLDDTKEGQSVRPIGLPVRSEEHTSELQSLMRISYAVFCLKKKNDKNTK